MNPNDTPMMPSTSKASRRSRMSRRSSFARKIGFGSSAPVHAMDLNLSATPPTNQHVALPLHVPSVTPEKTPRKNGGVIKRLRRVLSFSSKHLPHSPVTPILDAPVTDPESATDTSTSSTSSRINMKALQTRENQLIELMTDVDDRLGYYEASVAILKRSLAEETANLKRYKEIFDMGQQELERIHQLKHSMYTKFP